MTHKLIDFYQEITNAPDLWRKGQAYFNAAYLIFPDIANEVRGSKIDPFYNDDVIPEFVQYIIETIYKST